MCGAATATHNKLVAHTITAGQLETTTPRATRVC